MRVTGLHKLPFDQGRFDTDCESIEGSPDEAAMRKQLRANHDNAWIVVVESDDEIDFGEFGYPTRDPDAQAAWLEQELDAPDGGCRAAFFLHYVEPGKPLWYGKQKLALLQATSALRELVEQMDYCSPD